MEKKIIAFIDELKSNKKLATFDEASTKQAVVLRLLSFLDWDIFNVDEISPDYSMNVSFALRIKNSNKVFIKVKRVHEKLDNFQKPLLNAASREDVNLAVLTNGITWWFYLISGGSQHKWFYSIDLIKQKPDTFVPYLIDLLAKNKVARGQSLKAAKALFQHKRQKMAADFLPESWNQIISQPNKIFVELLADITEKLSGYKVDSKSVEAFLAMNLSNWRLKSTATTGAAPPSMPKDSGIVDLKDELPSMASDLIRKQSAVPSDSYAAKSIESFSFNGQSYSVRGWDEVLTILCEHFATTRPKDFEKVLWISNDQNPLFSRNSDQLKIPEKIKRTDIWVETKLKPDDVVKTAGKLLHEFGYGKDDLKIVAR